MTIKYVGEISYVDGKVVMPTSTDVPDKKLWNNYSVFKFNGKRYLPMTHKAEANVNSVIKQIEAEGKKTARKEGKIKPSSIRYGILTTGIEDFIYV